MKNQTLVSFIITILTLKVYPNIETQKKFYCFLGFQKSKIDNNCHTFLKTKHRSVVMPFCPYVIMDFDYCSTILVLKTMDTFDVRPYASDL